MSVLLSPNYYIATQHSHKVIMNFHNLQVFSYQANHRLTLVPYRYAFVWEPSATRNLQQTSNGGKASGFSGLAKPPSMTRTDSGLQP
jgi:hypothetical protein